MGLNLKPRWPLPNNYVADPPYKGVFGSKPCALAARACAFGEVLHLNDEIAFTRHVNNLEARQIQYNAVRRGHQELLL